MHSFFFFFTQHDVTYAFNYENVYKVIFWPKTKHAFTRASDMFRVNQVPKTSFLQKDMNQIRLLTCVLWIPLIQSPLPTKTVDYPLVKSKGKVDPTTYSYAQKINLDGNL